MANNSKRGFSPVLAFILGFLLALIILVGAVAGAVIFALNYKLDKLSFNKDEQGNYLYINADPDNGGVGTALDLIKKASDMFKDTSNLTLGEFEEVFPVTEKLTNGVHDALSKYVELDMDELKAVKFNALGEYMEDVLRDIRPVDYVEKSELTDKVIGDITLGDLIDGTVNFEQRIDELEITTFVDIDPENKIMVYLGFGITGLHNEAGHYTGKYTLSDGTQVNCRLETESNKATAAYYTDGGEDVAVPVTTVEGMNSRLDNINDELALSDVMDVKAPTESDKNAVMLYLAFSVAEVEATPNGNEYAAVYKPDPEAEGIPCTLVSDGNNITEVYYELDGVKINPDYTSISGASSQVTNLTKTLRLKEVIDIPEDDKVMVKLGDYVIDDVGHAADELTLDDFMDVTLTRDEEGNISPTSSEVVLAYMAFGLTDIEERDGVITAKYNVKDENEVKHKYDAIVTTEITENGEVITKAVAYIDGDDGEPEPVEIKGTPVNEVSERVDGVTTDIEIGQLMKIEDNRMLEALRHSTVDSLPDDVDKLSINELYYDEIYKTEDNPEAVMRLAVAEGAVSDEQTEIEFSPDYLYYVKPDENKDEYEMINAGTVEAGKVDSFNPNEKYYTYGVANSTWKLLLYENKVSETDPDVVISSTEKAYSVNDMTALINNVKFNVRRTTMYELEDAEIVKMGEDALATPVYYEGKLTRIGFLTLDQLLKLFVQNAQATSPTP